MIGTIRPRSLISNSLTSIAASGIVIVATLIVPALLSRLITPGEYSLYATVLSLLPLLLIIPQATRTIAGSALVIAYRQMDSKAANVRFIYFLITVITIILVSGVIGAEVYLHFYPGSAGSENIMRIGLYGLVLNVVGISVALAITGPATAQHDFIPENLLKIMPSVIILLGVAAAFAIPENERLIWIFLVTSLSTWIAFAIIFLLFTFAHKDEESNHSPVKYEFRTNIGSLLRQCREAFNYFYHFVATIILWNLTAFLCTTASIAILAFYLPAKIVAFSVAVTLTSVLSGGLIAISSPIASKVAQFGDDDVAGKKTMFRKFNAGFQLYIVCSAIFLLLLPHAVFLWWVGGVYAADVRYFMTLLIPAYCLSLLTMCFTLFLMGSGRQRTIWLSPLIQAMLSVVFCFLLVRDLGVEGIALALFIANAVRLTITLFYDVRINRDTLPLSPGDILLPGFAILRR